jgi:hypothetical protein
VARPGPESTNRVDGFVNRLDELGRQFGQSVHGGGVGADLDEDFVLRAADPAGFTTGNDVSTCKRLHFSS